MLIALYIILGFIGYITIGKLYFKIVKGFADGSAEIEAFLVCMGMIWPIGIPATLSLLIISRIWTITDWIVDLICKKRSFKRPEWTKRKEKPVKLHIPNDYEIKDNKTAKKFEKPLHKWYDKQSGVYK